MELTDDFKLELMYNLGFMVFSLSEAELIGDDRIQSIVRDASFDNWAYVIVDPMIKRDGQDNVVYGIRELSKKKVWEYLWRHYEGYYKINPDDHYVAFQDEQELNRMHAYHHKKILEVEHERERRKTVQKDMKNDG
jgi:hypothetical protein